MKKENSIEQIAKWLGVSIVVAIALILIFVRDFAWMIVPISSTLAIVGILLSYFASLKKLK